MTDIEVHIDLDGTTRQVGLARSNRVRGAETVTFEIDLDEGTCSIDLLEAAAGYFGLGLAAARTIIREVTLVTAIWRVMARQVGARPGEITRMASAFEHDDLRRALVL